MKTKFKDIPEYYVQFFKVLEVFKSCGLNSSFLDGGALLGVIRSGEFIGTDKDIDIGCYYSELQSIKQNGKFFKLILSMRNLGYAIEVHDEHQVYFRKYDPRTSTRYKVDIFAFEAYEEIFWHKGWSGVLVYPKECLEVLKEFKFKGKTILIPSNVRLFLATVYGESWNIPNPLFKKPEDYKNYFAVSSIKEVPNIGK